MATLTIAGDYTSALTHFALYGLSLICLLYTSPSPRDRG